MANEYKIQDLIDQFIKGELEGEALDKFKNKLRDDQEFAKKVELQKALVTEIQAQRSQELKDYITENAKVEYIQNIWSKKWMYASAAIVTLTIGLYFALQRFEMSRTDDLVKNKTESQEQVADSQQEEQATDATEDVVANGKDTARIQEPAIVIAEDEAEEKQFHADVSEPETNDVDDEAVTLTELSKEERKIASDDREVVEKDSLLYTKTFAIIEIVETSPGYAAEGLEEIKSEEVQEVVVTEKRPRKKRRDREQKNKAAAETDSALANGKANDAFLEQQMKKITRGNLKVEFWKSVVRFEGYKYDGNTLQLYGVDPTAPIALKKYKDSLYISISGTYFALQSNNRFNKYKQVNDGALLEILAK